MGSRQPSSSSSSSSSSPNTPSTSTSKTQNEYTRKATHSGSWYPSSPIKLSKDILSYLPDDDLYLPDDPSNIMGIVAPHGKVLLF